MKEWKWENMQDEEKGLQARWLAGCGIGRRYHEWTHTRIRLDGAELLEVIRWGDAVYESVMTNRTGFLFWGGVGTGKTTLLRILAGAVWAEHETQTTERPFIYLGVETTETVERKGIGLVYVHGAHLMNDLDVWASQLDGRIEKYKSADLLLIDDFGVGVMTDRSKSNIEGLIEYRYMNSKSTCVATNLTPVRLCGVFPRAGDRLREREWVRTMCVMGMSQRN